MIGDGPDPAFPYKVRLSFSHPEYRRARSGNRIVKSGNNSRFDAVRFAMSLLALLALATGALLWTPDLDRAELEARYAAPPSRFVEAAGARLHVRDTGPREIDGRPAPVIVLLHGFGSSLHTWEAWSAELSKRHRTIRFDLPGAGLTGADPRGDYTDLRAVEILNALLDGLGVRRATVLGHSMGGRIAWRFAAERPERVERLVLMAPDGFANPAYPQYGRSTEVPLMARLMQYTMPRSLVRISLAPAFADPAVMNDALAARYHDMLRAPGVRAALLDRMAQTVLQEPEPFLRRIGAPVLLLWGERDAMIPVANAQDYLRALPDARLAVPPGVGPHIPQEEAPRAALRAIEAVLDR